MWLIWETIIVSKTNKTQWNCVFAQRLKCTCVLLFQILALSSKSVIKVFTCKPGCLYHCTLYSETHADTFFCKWKKETEVVLYVYLSSTIRNDLAIKDKGSQQEEEMINYTWNQTLWTLNSGLQIRNRWRFYDSQRNQTKVKQENNLNSTNQTRRELNTIQTHTEEAAPTHNCLILA